MPLKTIPILRRGGPLRINRRNKLTRGLVWCVAPGATMRELVGKGVGRTVANEFGVHRSRNAFGVACRSIDNYTVGGLKFPSNSRLKTVGVGFTIAFVGTFESAIQGFTGLLSFPLTSGGSANDGIAMGLRRTSATTAMDCFVSVTGDAYDDGTSPGMLEIGTTPHIYACTRDNDGVMQHFYKDGVQFSTGFASSAAPVNWGTNAFGCILNTGHGDLFNYGNAARGTCNIGAVWNRALTPAEHASFAADPGQIFVDETAEDEELLILAVPGVTTITADRTIAVDWKATMRRDAVLNVENVGTDGAVGNRLIFDDPLIGSGFT